MRIVFDNKAATAVRLTELLALYAASRSEMDKDETANKEKVLQLSEHFINATDGFPAYIVILSLMGVLLGITKQLASEVGCQDVAGYIN